MKLKLLLLGSSIILMNTVGHTKEYIGIDIANTTIEEIKQKLARESVPYTIRYEKDNKGKEIQDIASLYFNDYSAWQKYGKVKEATIHFVGGKAYAMKVSWIDDKKGSLFEDLSLTFRKKYGVVREPATDGRDWDNVTYGLYSDTHTHVRLEKTQIWPSKLKPFNWYYITAVRYQDIDFGLLKKKYISTANAQYEQKYQFANDF